jgi:hypothetical protein
MVRLHRPPAPTLGLFEIYGGIGALLLLVARFVPLARYWPLWGCPLRKETGIPCLSCGMTRAFDWFMQGRFLDSLRVNPLGFVLAVLSVLGGAYFAGWALRLRLPRVALVVPARWELRLRGIAVLILVANWVYVLARALAVQA